MFLQVLPVKTQSLENVCRHNVMALAFKLYFSKINEISSRQFSQFEDTKVSSGNIWLQGPSKKRKPHLALLLQEHDKTKLVFTHFVDLFIAVRLKHL